MNLDIRYYSSTFPEHGVRFLKGRIVVHSSLYHRLSQFRPHFWTMAVVACVALALLHPERLLPVLAIGAIVMAWIELFPRIIPWPTPRWQQAIILSVNILLVSLLVLLIVEHHRYVISFYVLNTVFVTLVYGRWAGFIATVLSVAAATPIVHFTLLELVFVTGVHILLVQLIQGLSESALLADLDALTGLYNRRFLAVYLPKTLELAAQSDDSTALVMLDIDCFKQYNDHHGHLKGDRVLEQLARVLRATLRPTDRPCRYGGDEFVIVLPQTTLEDAIQITERVRAVFAGTAPAVSSAIPESGLSISAGVFASNGPQMSASALIHMADSALYKAKQCGRNSVQAADYGPVSDPVQA